MNREELKAKLEAYIAVNKQSLPYEFLGSRYSKNYDPSKAYKSLGLNCVHKKMGERTWQDIHYTTDALISDRWRTGGLTGGNCWGDEANQSVEGDDEPEFLEKVLEEILPGLTISEFRKLIGFVETESFSQGEYYGNYNNYKFKYIKLADILEVLCEK